MSLTSTAPRAALALAAAALALGLAAPAQALTLNGFRHEHHLPALHANAKLNRAARAHARDLAARDELDHDGFYSRMAGYGRAAENVAYGCGSEDCVMRMWARSPGHRRNMLMPGLKHYGLSSAVSRSGKRYWVLELSD